MPKRGSCGSVLPGCRLSKQYPSINSPAARCCTSPARRDAHCILIGSPVCRDTRRLVLASRLPSRVVPTCNPHSARCSARCHTSRDFVPWRFLDAGQLILWSVSSLPASKNQHKSGPKPVLDQLVRGTVGSRQQGVGHGHWHGAARTDGPLRTLHNLNRHAEVDEPRLQERQRQHVPRVDVVCAVAGVRPYIEV